MQALTSQLSTHYVDKYYNVIFQSSDKSDDVIKVPDDRIADFLALLQASSWDVNRIHSSGFNDYLKGEYGLADYQFSEAQLNALDQFSTTWSRNNAARFMLNPTMVNALRMGLSEVLSQWTNPELVATGLSAGISGLQGLARGTAKGGGKELYNFGKTAAQHMTEPRRKVPLQFMDDVLKTTKGLPDPGGSRALMHYTPMWKNGTQYNLKILYDQTTNSIWHFKYTQKALGPLPLIP